MQNKMTHPLICPSCHEYRYIEYFGVRFENDEKDRGYGVSIPVYNCKSCGKFKSILPEEQFLSFKNSFISDFKKWQFLSDLPLKYIFSKLDPDLKFQQFEHLGFEYDSRDYYLIPGLRTEWEDGYLTPVFFDKDLLLYYNSHPDYSVRLTSFSSGNIYFKGKNMFDWGFGINRSGKIFKWLGDLDKDFEDDSMKAHLKRFQASNIPSDHDIVSKFYLSQIPFSPEDAFQSSDNEIKLFSLYNKFSNQVKNDYGIEITKVEIEKLSDYFKPPILEEREQVFNAFLSLNKYFIENLQEKSLREILIKSGLQEKELEKDGKKYGSIKLFGLYLEKVAKIEESAIAVSPLFVLNDLRQLHGHLSDTSFDSRYNYCKERLGLNHDESDLDVFKNLISFLIELFKKLIRDKE